MKMFGVVILTIMTCGVYGIVYAAKQKKRRRTIKYFADAVKEQALAYDAYDKNLSEDDKRIVNQMLEANNKYATAWTDLTE